MAPELRVAGAWSWTHVDKVVGIGVLLGGKVVQIGQVLVLGDREGRAYTSEAGAQRGSLEGTATCPSCTGRVTTSSPLSAYGLLLGPARRDPFELLGGFYSY